MRKKGKHQSGYSMNPLSQDMEVERLIVRGAFEDLQRALAKIGNLDMTPSPTDSPSPIAIPTATCLVSSTADWITVSLGMCIPRGSTEESHSLARGAFTQILDLAVELFWSKDLWTQSPFGKAQTWQLVHNTEASSSQDSAPFFDALDTSL